MHIHIIFAVWYVETKTNARVGGSIVATKKKVIPIAAKAENATASPEIQDVRFKHLVNLWISLSTATRSKGSLRSSMVESFIRRSRRLLRPYGVDMNL